MGTALLAREAWKHSPPCLCSCYHIAHFTECPVKQVLQIVQWDCFSLISVTCLWWLNKICNYIKNDWILPMGCWLLLIEAIISSMSCDSFTRKFNHANMVEFTSGSFVKWGRFCKHWCWPVVPDMYVPFYSLCNQHNIVHFVILDSSMHNCVVAWILLIHILMFSYCLVLILACALTSLKVRGPSRLFTAWWSSACVVILQLATIHMQHMKADISATSGYQKLVVLHFCWTRRGILVFDHIWLVLTTLGQLMAKANFEMQLKFRWVLARGCIFHNLTKPYYILAQNYILILSGFYLALSLNLLG
jgi:hypothetical protein